MRSIYTAAPDHAKRIIVSFCMLFQSAQNGGAVDRKYTTIQTFKMSTSILDVSIWFLHYANQSPSSLERRDATVLGSEPLWKRTDWQPPRTAIIVIVVVGSVCIF
jgi:hypothetical protein